VPNFDLNEMDIESIKQDLKKYWGYEEVGYWDPLEQKSPNKVIYYDKRIALVHEQEFTQLVKQREEYVYFCGEVGYYKYPASIIETIFAYESIVTGSDFEWVTYLSHEGTITFGGKWLIDEVHNLLSAQELATENQWPHI
jgi:hypothetical protein